MCPRNGGDLLEVHLAVIYYLSTIAIDPGIRAKRQIPSNEAAKWRTLFVAEALARKVKILSLGYPNKKGFFRSAEEKVGSDITLCYFPAFNLLGLKFITYFLEILLFALTRIHEKDTVIMYNLSPIYVFPIFIAKVIKRFQLTVQIEELYSAYRFCFFKNALFGLAERLGLRIGDSYIVVSSPVAAKVNKGKRKLINIGFQSRIEPYPVNKETYCSREATKPVWESNNIPMIVYSGRLDVEGGIDVFLSAIDMIREPVRVFITGVGIFEDKVRLFVPKSGIVEYRYLGYLPRWEYERFLDAANICVNPIRTGHAFSTVSFPSKVFQYLEFGKIVVSSKFVGFENLPDELRRYVLVYTEDDARSLAQMIHKAMSYPADESTIKKEYSKFMAKQSEDLRRFIVG